MIVYLDADFKVYATLADDRIEIEDTFFDNKCTNLIESYRYIPIDKTWMDKGGREFAGPMIAPWRDIHQYDEEQQQCLLDQIAQYESALPELDAALLDAEYKNIIGEDIDE